MEIFPLQSSYTCINFKPKFLMLHFVIFILPQSYILDCVINKISYIPKFDTQFLVNNIHVYTYVKLEFIH